MDTENDESQDFPRQVTGRLWFYGIVLVIFAYFISYLFFRASHIKTWEREADPVLVFPRDTVSPDRDYVKWLYTFYQPLVRMDRSISGIEVRFGEPPAEPGPAKGGATEAPRDRTPAK